MITSTANPQVKNLIQLVKKAKVRNEQRLFVVEGIRMFREIPEGWLDRIYVSEHFMEEESHVKVLQGKIMKYLPIMCLKVCPIPRHRRESFVL